MLVVAFDNQRKTHMESIQQLEDDFEAERSAKLQEARRQHEIMRNNAAQALQKENKRTEK